MGKTVFRLIISVLIIAVLDFLSSFLLIPDDYNDIRTSHYYYHHGLLPGKEMLTAWGSLVYPVKTNSLGMVDNTSGKVETREGNTTLLILGDSHSEGVGVAYEKTFAGILDEELGKQGVDVFNASCISYSPRIAYLKARYLIEKQDFVPDMIFVLIDISDLQNELVYEDYHPDTSSAGLSAFKQRAHNYLRNYSSIYFLVHSIRKQKELEEFNENAALFDEFRTVGGDNNTLELYSGFFDHFDDNTLLSNPMFHGVGEWYYDDEFRQLADRGLNLGAENLRKLKRICDERDIELILSVHPWHSQIRKGETEDYYTNRWKEFADEEGLPFLNLFPLFIGNENPAVVVSRYYIKGDNHWNEFGHRKVGDYLLEYFNQLYFK